MTGRLPPGRPTVYVRSLTGTALLTGPLAAGARLSRKLRTVPNDEEMRACLTHRITSRRT